MSGRGNPRGTVSQISNLRQTTKAARSQGLPVAATATSADEKRHHRRTDQ
jgi:hypothetical protein